MKLFLDDIRKPYDCFLYTKNEVYLKGDWLVVKNYDEFVKELKRNKFELISFDHDLAEEHYVPEFYWNDYVKSKEYQDSKKYKEKTGLNCAMFMCDYYKDNNLIFPKILIHSQNPVGKDNIKYYIENFLKHNEK